MRRCRSPTRRSTAPSTSRPGDAEARADRAPETRPAKALCPLAVLKAPGPGKAHRDGDDLRAPARGRRPRRPRPLGGRPADGQPPEPGCDRDPGRAPNALLPARRPARGNRGRAGRGRARREHRHAAGPASALAHLGPGPRDGRAPALLRSRPGSRSTSAIPEAPGSGARTRTPTASCASTSRSARASQGVTQERLDEVAAKLNRRPRKTLGFRTPAEKLAELIDGLETTGAER